MFKKDKYEGIERRPINKVGDDEVLGYEIKKPAARIILSDEDDADADGDIEDLLNLENEFDSGSQTDGSEGLPDVNEAMEDRANHNDGLEALLSGKFNDDNSACEEDIEASAISRNDVKIIDPSVRRNAVSSSSRMKSIFIDDEASDEDEEKENDEIDEEALQEEMQKSNFIVDSCESDADSEELRAFANDRARKEDYDMEQKLMAKFGNHFDEGGEEDEFINSLGNKYGLIDDNQSTMITKKRSISTQLSLDEDIRKLLDPIEQKKRKLAALGSLNILTRHGQVEAASEEFQFVKKSTGTTVSEGSSDYYATDESDSDNSRENDSEEGGYYDEIESGLQSRVEEMLDEEMLDGEEVQVQANESLSIHLQTTFKSNENNSENIKDNTTIAAAANIPCTFKSRGVAVPTVDAKLKSRLLALQQENDDVVGVNNGSEKFKGFSIGKK